jgi:hypothetical protein
MNTGIVEFKFQDGTAIKITGSAGFAAAVMKVVLGVDEGKSSEHVQEGEIKTQRNPSSNRLEGLPPMFSPEWQYARSLLLERLGRTPTVGEVIEFLRESYQEGKFAQDDSLKNHELEAPAGNSSKSLAGRIKNYTGHSKMPRNAAASVITTCIGQRVEAT